MPAQNPLDALFSTTPAPVATPPPSGGSSNPLDSLLSGGSAQAAPAATVPSSSNPLDNIFGSSSSPLSGQPSGPTGPASHLYQDETQPWYKRAWDWANTPVTESVFGLPESREGAGGFERGVEKVAGGLTSPLSLALTAATFGTGGAIESAGATALKESGLFTAEELPQIVKASEAALQAFKDQKAIEPTINAALEAGGHDIGLLQRAKELTSNLVPDTKFGEPAVQNVLEKAGFSEAEREALAQTSSVIEKAKAGFKPVEDAVREAGVDPALWKRGQDILYQNGLTESDLLGGNLMERGTFQLLRKAVPDLPIAVAARAAKTGQQLMNAGFTYQQLEMGAQMSPQFLDALKSGDYDKAMEYGTEMAAGYGMGALGATHALHTAGELFKPLVEEGKFRPNDEWLAVDRTNKEREAQHAVAEQHAIDIDQHARQLLGHEKPRAVLGDSSEVKALKQDELAETFAHAETGSDAEKAAAIAAALREADGRTQGISPENGQPLLGTPIPPADTPPRANTQVIHSNDTGEVRVGADGRPVVWLNPEGWNEIKQVIAPGTNFTGVSLSPTDTAGIEKILPVNSPVRELVAKARSSSPQGLLTTATSDHPEAVRLVSEELHHTWQRELSKTGDFEDHLDSEQFSKLHDIIPAGWHKVLDEKGYDKDPALRVTETGAQFMSGRYADAPGSVTDQEVADFIKAYRNAIIEKHGGIALKTLDKINDVARQHVEDINAARETNANGTSRLADQGTSTRSLERSGKRGRGSAGVGEKEPGSLRSQETKPEGLKARELSEDEVQHPIGFVSPNVHNLPNVQDAEFRLNSRPQKLAENLSKDFAEALPGVKAVVRPAIGHWEGGAENSTIQRFAPGTDPDAVEYHNAFVTKAGYQNMGAGFIPGAGSDKLFQFRVPLGTADAAQIGQVLEAHGIPGDTIEPVPGGHLVHVVSPGDTLRARVAEAASRLDAGNIGETNGRAFQHGDYESRDAAQRVLDTRLAELESKHPTWGPVRKAFESRPDYVGLSQLTRQPREPFVNAVHGTRAEGLDTVSPEKQFTGPQKGAEKARAEAFPKDYVKKSYWRVPGTHGERFYERQPYQYKARFNSENLYPYVDDPEKLLPAAQQEAAARGIQNQPGAIGTIYERMMKDSGYDGYYHPSGEIATFKDTPVEQEMREGTSPLSGQVPALGLAARDWGEIKKYLTPEEQDKHNTDEKKNSLVTAFNALPDAEEWSDAVKAGRAGQMWYERSSRAFDALLDSGFKALHPADKDKFLNFVAALSPVQPVKTNLVMALEQWAKWDKAGRPTDVVWKDGKPNKSSKLYQMMRRGVDLQSRLGNSIRALQGEPLSGPKVSAFTKNLGEDVNRVTNDTWMAVLAGQDPGRINKPAVYDSMSAKIREAAETHGIAPRQAQAAAWSFIKSLAELSGWGNDRWIPPQEIVKQGLLTPELVAAHSADFADLLQHDPQIRGLITKLGGDLNAFDEKLKSYVPERPAQGETPAVSDRLLNAAGRLEAARTNSAIQRHLEAKSGPQGNFNFDQATDFNPAYMDQHISGGTGIGAKYMPLYARDNQAPTWFLKSNQIIDSRMQGPMPADTVQKMLENNGVKPDEMKYTGLSDFLKEKGKEPVRPEEIRQYLAANNLQVQEVTKGKAGSRVDPDELINNLDRAVAHGSGLEEAVARFPEELREKARRLAESNQRANALPENDPILPGVRDQLDHLTDELYANLNDLTSRNGETKFGTYTLPGGQNYREMLLTLPKDQGPDIDFVGLDRQLKAARARGDVAELDRLEKVLTRQMDEGRKKISSQPDFRSSHWDEPNVVGHVRFNDRVGPNGEKLLHLEELQSDWHQKGRTQGYKSELTPEEEQRRYQVVRERNAAAEERAYHRQDQDSAAFNEATSRLETLDRELESLNKKKNGGVPDAPFKKTWPELLMKRMVRYAAEHGYDGVSWTPGEEQAARYDLSKQVDSIKYAPKEGLLAAQKDGRNVIEKENVSPEQLPDLIGKEAARKLLETDTGSPLWKHHLAGQDLKIGGEGMKGFYDKIVPDLANKLGKQFGAKVGETEIRATYEKPGSWAEENLGKLPGKKVPYFPITDSMRESVLKQGQPLFAKDRPNNGQLPSNIDDMIQNNKFKDQPKEYKDRVIRAYERVASGTSSDRVLQASKYLRDEQDKNWQIGSANDLLHNYIEDYMTRVYKDQNPEGKVILSNAKQGRYATNVNMARQRVYESTLTALLKSPKELFLDPVQTTAQGRAQLIKAAANRQLIDKLRDAGVRASDGRPAVVLSGTGRVVTGQNGEDPKTFVDPNRVRKINLSDDMVEGLKKNGDFDRFLEDGTLRDITPYIHPNNIQTAISRMEDQAGRREAQYDAVGNNKLRTDIMLLKSMVNNGDFSGLKEFNDAQPKKYAWDPQDYVSLDNGAMKGWNFVTNDSAGNGVLVRSDIKVHPEFAEYLKNRLGLNPSTIGKNPIGKALLGAGTKLKHTLLSLSPFHMVQIALRGVMTGVNPFTLHAPDLIHGAKVDPLDPNSPTKMYKMVEQGMTVGTDYRAMQEHSEGVAAGGSALRLIPGVGKTLAGSMDWFQDFLFRRYIPAIKAVAAEHMFDEYQRLHPEWSTDKVARMAGTHANDSFGGINWKAMGRSATTQDWGRLMLLAPDWLESEMRSGIRLFNGDDGGLGRAQVAKMALGLWGIARVLNLLTTGNAHYEAPFGLAVKNKEGKETVFGIRTLPTDLLHAADDPVGFIKGRLSPTVRMGQELLTQRDQFGRKLAPEDMWVDIFRNMAPIAAQSIGQAVTGTGPEIGNAGQIAKAMGATAQVYRTPAQKLAAELASNHNEDGPVDRTQMARHRQVMQLEDQLRSGDITWPDLVKLTYQTDQLKESELKKIQNNFKKTQGMAPDMASLYTRAARLPAAEYLQLLDQMNPQEKAALSTLTLQVQKRYLNKAKKEMTPEERSKDPVFNRFMKMIPQTQQQQAAPQPQSFYTPPQTKQTPLQKEVAYLYTATHPQTGHKVGSNDGQNWVDHQTGEPVNG